MHRAGCNQGRHFKGILGTDTPCTENQENTFPAGAHLCQVKKKKGGFQGEETRCAKKGTGVSKGSENCTLLCSAPVHAVGGWWWGKGLCGWLRG